MYRRDVEAPPRLAREGWVPAAPDKRVNKRAMLIPKTGKPSDHLPTIYDFCDSPRERRVLGEICETGDLIRENGHTYLVARVSSYTVDTLAAFESERADLEEGGDDELEPDLEQVNEDRDDSDLEPDQDEEYDFPRERQKYTVERQQPGREYILNGRRFVDSPSYDSTRDDEELRKAKRQVNALAAKKRKRVKIEDRTGAGS